MLETIGRNTMSNDKVELVPCLNCGTKFSPARPWSKFCGEKCRNCYNNDRRDKKREGVVLKCPHCKNDEEKMLELLTQLNDTTKTYLCNVCAKEFVHDSSKRNLQSNNGNS